VGLVGGFCFASQRYLLALPARRSFEKRPGHFQYNFTTYSERVCHVSVLRSCQTRVSKDVDRTHSHVLWPTRDCSGPRRLTESGQAGCAIAVRRVISGCVYDVRGRPKEAQGRPEEGVSQQVFTNGYGTGMEQVWNRSWYFGYRTSPGGPFCVGVLRP